MCIKIKKNIFLICCIESKNIINWVIIEKKIEKKKIEINFIGRNGSIIIYRIPNTEYRIPTMSELENAVEIGLKKQVKRQVGLKEWEQNVGNHSQTHLVNTWKIMINAGMKEQVSEMIWDYCLSSPSKLWIKVNSSVFGIYSTIGEYENQKGNKSLAHFTESGHYIGSVSKLGSKPIAYVGNFKLSKMRFQLIIENLNTLNHFNGAYILEHLFRAIPVV